jgi:hypothetical protein
MPTPLSLSVSSAILMLRPRFLAVGLTARISSYQSRYGIILCKKGMVLLPTLQDVNNSS